MHEDDGSGALLAALPFVVQCAPPFLIAKLGLPYHALGWSLDYPGFSVVRDLVWFEVRSRDLGRAAGRPKRADNLRPHFASPLQKTSVSPFLPACLWSLTSDVGDAVPDRGVLRGHLRATLGRDANKVGGPRRAPDEAALARVGAGGSAAGAGGSGDSILELDLGLPGGRHTHDIPVESVPPDEALPAGIRATWRCGQRNAAAARPDG